MFRLGPSVFINPGPHFSVQAMLTFPVIRPDPLAFTNQIWGTVGVQWYWASGEPKPGFL